MPLVKHQYIRDLREKDLVRTPFLIKFSAVATSKNGKPYMNLILMDKTGEVDARLFENVQAHMGQVVRDAFVMVEGRCQLFNGRKQIVISQIEILREDDVTADDFIPVSAVNPEALHKKLLSYVETMQDPFYKALAEAILRDDAEIVDKMKRAPAAKSVHHAYRSGLIEHVVSITGILDGLCTHYGAIVDRDLLFLGGFFHDIGKLWELSYDGVTDYSDEGRLIGHHVIGVELVDRKIRELEAAPGRLPGAFPVDKKLLVKHVILAHHGKLEYGSPKEPACLEAVLVHMVDDLDSKVNALTTFVRGDQNLGRWTGLHRQYQRFFYKPDWVLQEQAAQQSSLS